MTLIDCVPKTASEVGISPAPESLTRLAREELANPIFFGDVHELPLTVFRAFQRAGNRAKDIARWRLFMGRGQELLRTLEVNSARIIACHDRLPSQFINHISQFEHK